MSMDIMSKSKLWLRLNFLMTLKPKRRESSMKWEKIESMITFISK